MEVVPGVGDRITLLLRRHATIGTLTQLSEQAQLSRQTLHRAVNENTLTRETARAIAKALGVTLEDLIPPPLQLGESPAPAYGGPPEPRHSRNLPFAVRQYLAEFQLRLTKGGATEEEIEEALTLIRSPDVFSYFAGGKLNEFNETDVLDGMKSIAEDVVIPKLRKMGRKIR